jgi:hypothetical protein
MNTKNASSTASDSMIHTGTSSKAKKLFGLSVDELKLVTGGGGVIIQGPGETILITGMLLAPEAPIEPATPLAPLAPFAPARLRR